MSVAPFLIGLAGSLHCIGMCGPLSSVVTSSGRNPILKRIFYNTGRLLMYGLLGAMVSFFGGIVALSGIGNWVSWMVGGLFLLVGITGVGINTPRFLVKPLIVFTGFLKAKFSILLTMKSPFGVVGMGMINGLLPCGMTWLALAYCVTLKLPSDGFISMMLFGLGTVPAMIAFPTIVDTITRKFHISFRTIQTALLIIAGCLLIGRTFITHHSIQSDEIVVCGTQSIITQ